MQKILFSLFVFSCMISSAGALGGGDRLDLAITPIKKELTLDPGSVITGSVTLYNNSDVPYPAQMGSEDCTSSNQYGTPVCVPHGGVGDPLYLSTWITFSNTGAFSIAPRSSYTMSYTIRAPIGAQPGGHYAGLIFRNLNPPTAGTVGMKRQMQSLILVTITGQMIVDPIFGSLLIDGHGGAGGGSPMTPYRDFFRFDMDKGIIDNFTDKGVQFLTTIRDPLFQKDILDVVNPFWEEPILNSAGVLGSPSSSNILGNAQSKKDPILTIGIPVDNKGTIHITPIGQVRLYEKDGTQLMSIGREYIKNEYGAPIGEIAVDYIPINSEGGSALPGIDRLYEINWFGFARETIGADRNVVVTYETPGEHYARVSREENKYLFPWEKRILSRTQKELIAKISISYTNPINKATVERNQDISVVVEYDEIVKSFNTGIVAPILLPILFIWWLVIWRRRRYIYPEIIDDEIAVLERARVSLMKTPIRKKPTPLKKVQKEDISVTPLKKTPSRSTKKQKPEDL